MSEQITHYFSVEDFLLIFNLTLAGDGSLSNALCTQSTDNNKISFSACQNILLDHPNDYFHGLSAYVFKPWDLESLCEGVAIVAGIEDASPLHESGILRDGYHVDELLKHFPGISDNRRNALIEHAYYISLSGFYDPKEIDNSDSERAGFKPASEQVDHPPHYNKLPIEAIELLECLGFCRGNAIKYLWRHEHKGKPLEDLEKARWYIKRELEQTEVGNRAIVADNSENLPIKVLQQATRYSSYNVGCVIRLLCDDFYMQCGTKDRLESAIEHIDDEMEKYK